MLERVCVRIWVGGILHTQGRSFLTRFGRYIPTFPASFSLSLRHPTSSSPPSVDDSRRYCQLWRFLIINIVLTPRARDDPTNLPRHSTMVCPSSSPHWCVYSCDTKIPTLPFILCCSRRKRLCGLWINRQPILRPETNRLECCDGSSRTHRRGPTR